MTQPIHTQLDIPPAKLEKYQKLFKQAHVAKENAYYKYSGYQVGASVLLHDGTVFNGCNVENASYGLTMCAERTAIFNAVSSGIKPGDIEAIAIAASATNFSPCGACRQVIHEFGEKIIVIYEFNSRIQIQTANSLLPHGYVASE